MRRFSSTAACSVFVRVPTSKVERRTVALANRIPENTFFTKWQFSLPVRNSFWFAVTHSRPRLRIFVVGNWQDGPESCRRVRFLFADCRNRRFYVVGLPRVTRRLRKHVRFRHVHVCATVRAVFASCLRSFAPGPAETDGEASTPGPSRRGSRSFAARLRRHARRTMHEQGCAADDSQRFDVVTDEFVIFHVNIHSLLGKIPELDARLKLSTFKPHIVRVNETWLDKATGRIDDLSGYTMVARRDRHDGGDERAGGGIVVFARADVERRVTLLSHPKTSERSWLLLHSDRGGFLLCVWYRPPRGGEVGSIDAFAEGDSEHSTFAIGTIVVGDLNVHQRSWLRHSSQGNTVEGSRLWATCAELGFEQKVMQPTRGENLLDLVLTNVTDVRRDVQPPIADHNVVVVRLNMSWLASRVVTREVWSFKCADWDAMNEDISSADWSFLNVAADADAAASPFTDMLVGFMARHISKRTLRERKSSHPWINDVALRLIAKKRDAFGTADEQNACDECSAGLRTEFGRHVERTKNDLQRLPRASKPWWAKSRELLRQKCKNNGIPALRGAAGAWIVDPREKADLFASTVAAKYVLAESAENCSSPIVQTGVSQGCVLSSLPAADAAQRALAALRFDSATGPDHVSSRVLRC